MQFQQFHLRHIVTVGLATSFVIVVALTGGCTSPAEGYCDESTPCPEGQVCDLATNTCGPPREAGLDGRIDGLDRGITGDVQNDILVDQKVTDAKLPNGTPCSQGSACASGFCTDGVCCDGECSDTCRSCAVSGSEGSCTLIAQGSDPDQECAGTVAACSGSCDGQGACAFPGASTSCGSPGCSNGKLTTHACDGQGGCTDTTTDCGGYACSSSSPGACKTSCTGTQDCVGTYQCVGGKCVNQLPNGSACGTNDAACASGHCVDGVCCDTTCTSTCKACNLPGKAGACSAVANGTTCGPTTCASATLSKKVCSNGTCSTSTSSCGLYQCDAGGTACRTACSAHTHCVSTAYCAATVCTAKKQNGVACTEAAECSSNICHATEKVCCDKTCTGGPCESCNLSGKEGTCSFKTAGTACGAPDLCVNGISSSHIVHNECTGGQAACQSVQKPCGVYRCDSSTNVCYYSCMSHDQCTADLCDLHDLFGKKGTCVSEEVCYVDATEFCPGAGTMASPYCTLQPCLDKLVKYVSVADGTYNESLTVKGTNRKVQIVAVGSQGPLVVNGAFQSGVTKVKVAPTANTPALAFPAGTGGLVHGLEFTPSGGGGNMVQVDSGALPVTFQTCNIHHGAMGLVSSGGVTKTSVTLADSVVTWCSSTGIDATDTDLTLDNALVMFNGQGLGHATGQLVMRDAIVNSNLGGGIQTYGSTLDLDRVKASWNWGHGLALENSTYGMVFNLVAAGNGNQGIYIYFNSHPTFVNVTVVDSANEEVECASSTNFRNSILWDKNDTSAAYTGQCTFTHSDVRGGPGGMSNIDQDPQFDSSNSVHPFSLVAASPCVDTGNDNLPGLVYPALDLAGNTRKVDKYPAKPGVIDMGAYEVQ